MPEYTGRYNAFISYRHQVLDMAVAAKLHRYLENFKLPISLRKKHNGLKRIFRDKDELPTSNDLIESIYLALDKSDYLIVVCSNYTPESIYIKNEVEYFMTKNPSDRIIVLQIQGELENILPMPLLGQYQRIKTGQTEEKFHIIDIRADNDHDTLKLLKTESIRLISVILNINEAELGEKYYRKLLLSSILAYTGILLAFFGFQLMHQKEFSRAVALNEKITELEEKVDQTERWSKYEKKELLYWTNEITLQMARATQYIPGIKPIIEDITNENRVIMEEALQGDLSGEDLRGFIHAYGESARVYISKGDYATAEVYLNKCIKLWNKLDQIKRHDNRSSKFSDILKRFSKNTVNVNDLANETYWRADYYRLKGIICAEQKQMNKAFEYFEKAYNVISDNPGVTKDNNLLLYSKLDICVNYATYLKTVEFSAKSRKYWLEAIECYQELVKGDKENVFLKIKLAQCQAELAIMAYENNDQKKSERYLKEARKPLEEMHGIPGDNNIRQELSNLDWSIGFYYYRIQKFNLANEFYMDSLRITLTIPTWREENYLIIKTANHLFTLGELSLDLGRKEEALKRYRDAYLILKKSDNGKSDFQRQSLCCSALIGLAQTYFFLNDRDTAAVMLDEAEKYACDRWNVCGVHQFRAILMMSNGQWQTAAEENHLAQKALLNYKSEGIKAPRVNTIRAGAILDLNEVVFQAYLGRTDRAVAISKQAVTLGLENDKPYFNAIEAFALLANGDYKQGLAILKPYQNKIVPGIFTTRFDKIETCINQPASVVVESLLRGLQKSGGNNSKIPKALEMLAEITKSTYKE